MEKIICHWSGGTHRASGVDREHYHLLIEGDGRVVFGDYEISDNESVADNRYAAHTRNLNTGSIGVAVCAMLDARQVPFDPGKYPITEAQVQSLVREVARLAKGYGIPITRQTVLSHAEVQPTLGVEQAGKWDITYLPGMTKPGDPIAVGDKLRQMISDQMSGTVRPQPKPVTPAPTPQPAKPAPTPQPAQPANPFAALIAWLNRIFRS